MKYIKYIWILIKIVALCILSYFAIDRLIYVYTRPVGVLLVILIFACVAVDVIIYKAKKSYKGKTNKNAASVSVRPAQIIKPEIKTLDAKKLKHRRKDEAVAIYCKNCGKPVQKENVYCFACGQKID